MFIYIIVHIYVGQSDKSSEVQEDSTWSLMVQSKLIATILELLSMQSFIRWQGEVFAL